MSPQKKREFATWIGIVLGILTFVGTATGSARGAFQGALGAKLDTAVYRRDQALRVVHDSVEHEILLDVLCSRNVDPRNRRCPRGVR